MEPVRHNAIIQDIVDPRVIAEVLKDGDPSVVVYVVGGFVRDYLFHQFHGDKNLPYQAKDIDLTTNLSESEILTRLKSPLAKEYKIGVKEKQSVDTFGVVFANVSGRGPFEIAPFRKDIGSSDGRHPDRVERGTIYEDAMRRDLTINNLYYNFDEHVILDFNSNGQGITDIRNKTVRTVGDPFKRFEEDKLRVLRLVRFFSRFNPGLIVEYLDGKTLAAIGKYKRLHDFRGMSPERIQTEFVLGLAQSLDTANYLQNYIDLDLLQAVFPDIELDLTKIRRLGTMKNHKVVLAALLANNDNVGEILNALKYPSSTSDAVSFLVAAMRFHPENAVELLKARDRRVLRKKEPLTSEEEANNLAIIAEIRQDIFDLASLTDDSRRKMLLQHLATYEPLIISGELLMMQGFQKEQIGIRQRELIQQGYAESLAAIGL